MLICLFTHSVFSGCLRSLCAFLFWCHEIRDSLLTSTVKFLTLDKHNQMTLAKPDTLKNGHLIVPMHSAAVLCAFPTPICALCAMSCVCGVPNYF